MVNSKIDMKDLFFKMIPVLYAQLQQLPSNFFEDGEWAPEQNNNFLAISVNNLFHLCEDKQVCSKIANRIRALKQMLQKQFGFKPSLTESEKLAKLVS